MKLLAFVASVLGACGYSADFDDCTILCTTAGCPEGLTCGSEGLCRAEQSEICVLPSDGIGGAITHIGGRTIHTFSMAESGSTFYPPADLNITELLVVGGGGGGGSTRGGGGGGAGGFVYMSAFAMTQPGYVVLMGFGGFSGTNGGDSSFGPVVAIGGGAGRPSSMASGGSGGGADHGGSNGGTATSGQGNNGGVAGYTNGALTVFTGGGGGGAGTVGAVGAPDAGGAGGAGLTNMISGSMVYYAGGGGGGGQDLAGVSLMPGPRGIGGGGDGGVNSIGNDGIDGTGGGGGGGGGRVTETGEPPFFRGGRGGNGVVIVSYPTRR